MRLIDSEGRSYLDFLAGIGVCGLGHRHAVLQDALKGQVERLLHVSNYFYVEHRGQAAALISKLANNDMEGARALADAIAADDEHAVIDAASSAEGEQAWQTFFANSGAEANEGAMKLARLYAKRRGNGAIPSCACAAAFTGARLKRWRRPCRSAFRRTFVRCPRVSLRARPTTLKSFGRYSRNLATRFAP